MEARKKSASARKTTTKRKPSSKSALAVKQILDEKIKLYQVGRASIVQEDAVVYGKSKPKQVGSKSIAANKKIEKKLKALKELIGIAPGPWSKDGDAQDYVNRLRDNDRF